MQTITIKVGQNVDFKVPVSGEPAPTCVWTFNEAPIGTEDAKIKIANEPYKTNFALRGATRNHAGKYTLTATNDSGVDAHSVQVIVLGGKYSQHSLIGTHWTRFSSEIRIFNVHSLWS